LQGPLLPPTSSSDDALQAEPNVYELMVNTIAFSAKAYWAMWGPLVSQPMISAVDRWAERQRGYLRLLLRG
jgi:hypothetical protein